MVDERKLEVLRAIVQDYVRTQEPVGSKTLVERHKLGVSSATVRNDMAALEEDGYIAQPHTSAGRIPTDKGYRLFVDRLMDVKPLSMAERRAIQRFLTGAIDLDDVVARTVRLLAQVTRQVAVVQYPSLTQATVRHVEVVPLTDSRLLLVAIADSGRVDQRIVELVEPTTEQMVDDVRQRLNERVANVRLNEVPDRVADFPDGFEPDGRPVATAVLTALLETLIERHDERVAVGGTANLSQFATEYPQAIHPVLEVLEEHVVLMRLLGEATNPALTVRIGEENKLEGLHATSIVSVGYGVGDEPMAKLGVIGPTRMDYPGTIGAVRAVAQYVSRILAGT
ncbi:MAG: heat-inducible transcriptional repressor HrcA [Streptosporangiales bacterium]|nr:heat-inducible transcriptional repressor HrcA [Streptosporangiales bacterium]